MNRSIVQDNYSLLRDIERESVKIVHNLVCVDGLFSICTDMAFVGIILHKFSFGIMFFKFLQLLFLVCVELR